MARKKASILQIAKALGLSTFTVSAALKDNPKVAEKTRERVKKKAKELGYKANPILSSALAAVRSSRLDHFQGTIAAIELSEDGDTEPMLFHREILKGAEKRASELGFNLELFWIGNGEKALSLPRLQGVLEARGINGILVLPLNVAQDLSGFDFSNFSAVQMDHCLIEPQINTILPDHYISMIHTLEHLKQFNYQRIGLCVGDRRDRRIKNKWSAAYQSFMQHYTSFANSEPYIRGAFEKKTFFKWFKKNQPEIIISDKQIVIDWLAQEGYRVPEDVGFLRINYTERTAPCAGIDLNPQRLGAAAVETLVGQIHRFEKGIPEYVKTTTIEATWVDGPTLITQPAEN